MNNKLIIAIFTLAFSILCHGIITKPQYIKYEVVDINENSVMIIDHEKKQIYRYHHTNYYGDNKLEIIELDK